MIRLALRFFAILGLLSFASPASAWAEKLPPRTDCPKNMNAEAFSELLRTYSPAFHSTQTLEQWELEDQITNAVFCSAGTPAYARYLKMIEKVAPLDQEAYYNLARRLQAHWQAQYALAMSKVQHANTQKVADISTKLAFLAMAIGALSKSPAVPQTFAIVRQLLPALIPVAAVGSSEVGNKLWNHRKKVPPAPAQLMSFPLPQENPNYDTYELVRNVTAASASVAGSQLAYNAIKVFRIGATIGKGSFNPVAILAAVLVGNAVTEIADVSLDEYEYHRLASRLLEQRDLLLASIRAKDYARMRTSAEDFKTSAILLSAFLERESMNAYIEFGKKIDAIKKDPKWRAGIDDAIVKMTGGYEPIGLIPSESERKRQIQRAKKDLLEKLAAIEAAQDPRSNEDVELAFTLSVISNDPENAKLLTGAQATQAKFIIDHFEGGDYGAYIAGLASQKNEILAHEFRAGQILRNPKHVLISAFAFIDSLHQPILSGIQDDLLNVLSAGEMLK